ncbi:MAG: divergent PAP2 family protein, partial [Patescibacteria group bacterium]
KYMDFYFIIPLFAVISAQIIKVALMSLKTGAFNPSYFLKHGRMPSAHTALVTSLATVAYYYEGFGSMAFAISVTLAFVVIDDAVRFRFYLGQQAKTVNRLIKDVLPPEKAAKYHRLHETLGHYPKEALAGAIYGIGVSLLLLKIL